MTSNKKMHVNEVDIDVLLVKQLLGTQFPKWAKLPITPVQSAGTDNAIYRLGTDMCLRLPRRPESANDIDKELRWLPQLAPLLPLAIPAPLGKGGPNENYPFSWAIYHWLEGENAAGEHIIDFDKAATDLAQFLIVLQKIDVTGAPVSRRGAPLATKDKETRRAIELLYGVVDIHAATTVWEKCLQTPVWDKPLLWTHGDLLPTNLLVKQGRVTAAIDFSFLGIGDPACDLIPAWSVFSSNSRKLFRSVLRVDETTWMRGCGWALSIALTILPYYQNSNPGLVAVAKRMLNEIFSDF